MLAVSRPAAMMFFTRRSSAMLKSQPGSFSLHNCANTGTSVAEV